MGRMDHTQTPNTVKTPSLLATSTPGGPYVILLLDTYLVGGKPVLMFLQSYSLRRQVERWPNNRDTQRTLGFARNPHGTILRSTHPTYSQHRSQEIRIQADGHETIRSIGDP